MFLVKNAVDINKMKKDDYPVFAIYKWIVDKD